MVIKLFKRKCVNCDKRKKVAYVEKILLTFDMKIQEFYCENCNILRLRLIEEKAEINKIILERESAKRKEQARLDYLKREVERVELERKAKDYGIIYPND